MSLAPSVLFTKYVNIQEYANIQKYINVAANVKGNSAIANSTADAMGYNSHAETLTQTIAIQGQGSSSVSESVSATQGAYFHW
jgi:hypothetical protein